MRLVVYLYFSFHLVHLDTSSCPKHSHSGETTPSCIHKGPGLWAQHCNQCLLGIVRPYLVNLAKLPPENAPQSERLHHRACGLERTGRGYGLYPTSLWSSLPCLLPDRNFWVVVRGQPWSGLLQEWRDVRAGSPDNWEQAQCHVRGSSQGLPPSAVYRIWWWGLDVEQLLEPVSAASTTQSRCS